MGSKGSIVGFFPKAAAKTAAPAASDKAEHAPTPGGKACSAAAGSPGDKQHLKAAMMLDLTNEPDHPVPEDTPAVRDKVISCAIAALHMPAMHGVLIHLA